MSLSPRAIATQGIGFSPWLLAVQGLGCEGDISLPLPHTVGMVVNQGFLMLRR